MFTIAAKLVIITLLIIVNPKRGVKCQKCSFDEFTGILKCSDFFIGNNGDDMLLLNLTSLMPANETHQVDQLIIENSTLPTLNLNFIGFNQLTGLSGLSIHECNITRVVGDIPCHVKSLRLSHNLIENVSPKLLKYGMEEDIIEDTSDSVLSAEPKHSIIKMIKTCKTNFFLDLAHNRLEELSVELVTSPRLKTLHLSGNPLKCEFIWEAYWDMNQCSNRHQKCRDLFLNPNITNCQFYRHYYSPGLFHYNLAQIFDSKIIFEAECAEMNKTCTCHPYNLLRGEDHKPTVYLTVTCTGRNLTELPKISSYTWELNVSSNNLQNLERLNSSEYRNLRRLDVSENLLDELSGLAYTDFMTRFDLLYINFNRIQKIPDAFLHKIKNSEGKGSVKLGAYLECDCTAATITRGRVIELQNKIKDFNDIVCGNLMNETTKEYIKLKNLKLGEFCYIPNANGWYGFDWMVPVIVLESICIIGVIIKVFYDWRYYHRTGILPWIAEKLPRLPCDGILE